ASASEPRQMIVTTQGLLTIDTPKGWVQSDGPGLAFFLPDGMTAEKADVWIYISSAPVGPNEENKDIDSYIQSDIKSFQRRFKHATVRTEEALLLPAVNGKAAVYTFQSGEAHNAFEQVIYISEIHRVLVLDLSAKNSKAFAKSMAVFHDFAQSYQGNIQMGSLADKPK
ncbi:MAG: hypothetical protein ABR991_04040, partial [Terracidiphilus sp.]